MRKIYKVAIVEDEKIWSDALEDMLRRYEREQEVVFQSALYPSVELFLSVYKERFDIVFMDIELPGSNGMEGARALRKVDPLVTLIFVTNLAQFAVQGYEVSAMDYLVKPVAYPNFAAKMQRALHAINLSDSKRIVVTSKTDTHAMSVHEILYVEVRGHHLLFHRTDGTEIDVCGSLTGLEESLVGMGFSRCSTCYLLNLKYVTRISGLTVTLCEGTELQISRRRRKDFVEEFAVYMGQTQGGAVG